MSDIAGLLDLAVYRLLVTRILPGGLAVSSYLALILVYSKNVRDQWKDYRTEAFILVFLVSSTVGLLIEALGAHTENRMFSKWRRSIQQEDKSRDAIDEWYRYLQCKMPDTPGRSYVSECLLFLKFEMHSLYALLVGVPGILALPIADGYKFLALLVIGLLVAALWRDVDNTVENLIDLRYRLVIIAPKHEAGPPAP